MKLPLILRALATGQIGAAPFHAPANGQGQAIRSLWQYAARQPALLGSPNITILSKSTRINDISRTPDQYHIHGAK